MRVAICVCFGLSAFACASTSQTELEMSKLRRDVRKLETDLEEARARVEALEGKVTLLSLRPKGSDFPAPAPMAKGEGGREGLPALPVVRLGGNAAKGASRQDVEDEGAFDDGGAPILIQVGPEAEDGRLPVDHEVLRKSDPVLSASRPPSSSAEPAPAPPAKKSKIDAAAIEYQVALSTLREQKNPSRAREMLEGFKTKYPQHDLSDNAAYWLAECSFAAREYARAAEEFQRVIDEFPRSDKVPDALLRIAMSYQAIGRTEEAGETFRRITNGYPRSEAAAEAQRAIAELDSREPR